MLTLQGDYEAPLKAGTKHVDVLTCTHSYLVGVPDLGVETQHREHHAWGVAIAAGNSNSN